MTSPFSLDDVTVVVVTYNSAHCVAHMASTLAALPHVIVVDNASADDTTARLAQAMPNAIVHVCERNLGFGGANNVALMQVKTRYALLLNPDCLVTTASLHSLMAVADQFPDAAIIAPHLIRKGERVELSYRWPVTHWESSGPQAEGPLCVGFVCGAAMLINTTVEGGFFDETFFLYYEDEDLCQRLFMAKQQIILAPHVHIGHLARGSVRGPHPLRAEYYRGFHQAQSKLIFAGKHVGAAAAASLRTRTLLLAFASLLPRILLPQPRYLARLLGRIAGLRGYKTPAPRPIPVRKSSPT